MLRPWKWRQQTPSTRRHIPKDLNLQGPTHFVCAVIVLWENAKWKDWLSDGMSRLLVLWLRLGFRLVGLRVDGFTNLRASSAISPSSQLEWLGTEQTREEALQCGYFELLEQQFVDGKQQTNSENQGQKHEQCECTERHWLGRKWLKSVIRISRHIHTHTHTQPHTHTTHSHTHTHTTHTHTHTTHTHMHTHSHTPHNTRTHHNHTTHTHTHTTHTTNTHTHTQTHVLVIPRSTILIPTDFYQYTRRCVSIV